jgi:hypothetical protein
MNCCRNTLIQKIFALVTSIACLTLITHAGAAETVTEAITSGKSSGSLRYFYEGVRNPGQTIKADASTARLRFGYETATYKNFAVMVEAETVHAFGAENYNSTVNGKTNYSVIVDPEGTEMNQAFISYNELNSQTVIKWGRQRINLDNSRFIGTRSWRQNEQTYDSFMLVNNYLPDTTITAGLLTNLNRPNTDAAIAPFGGQAGNFKMNSSPILNVKYKGLTAGEVVAYGYMLDFDLPASAAFANRIQFDSTKTLGLRFKGSTPMDSNNLLYTAEYATQSSYKDNPATYTNKYIFAEGGIDFKIAEFKLSHEVLGGDGANAFSTPLASLHGVNGWVDKFVTIPASGLKDTFLTAATNIADVNFMAVYRDYRADTGGAKYGTEWNFQATKNFDTNYMVGAKYASFKTSTTVQNTTQPWNFDTNKFWVWGEMQF